MTKTVKTEYEIVMILVLKTRTLKIERSTQLSYVGKRNKLVTC